MTGTSPETRLTPRQRFWLHKLERAKENHRAELRKMSGAGASLKTLDKWARQITKAERELYRAEKETP
jgi:hypothetical protein